LNGAQSWTIKTDEAMEKEVLPIGTSTPGGQRGRRGIVEEFNTKMMPGKSDDITAVVQQQTLIMMM